MADYLRPKDLRFQFGGINTNDPVDALVQSFKYRVAKNIRGIAGKSIRTRPGYTSLFTAGGLVTDIRAFASLSTDNLPRLLVRRSNNHIYLDNAVDKGTLSGAAQGVCMIPYRPNQSPQPWMYIGAPGDYQKFSAPDAADNVTQYKVGIREPTTSPDASPLSLNYKSFSALAASWTQGGVAGAPADAARVADTAGVAIADPASNNIRWSVQVAANKSYQVGEILTMGAGGAYTTVVEDVIPPIGAGAAITIKAIHYFVGNTGRCIIIPTQMPNFVTEKIVSALRRGALINLSGGPEIVLVLSITTGTDGSVAIEATTTGTHAAGETITGIPTIIVSDISAAVTGQAIAAAKVTSAFTGAGTGTLTQALATNPFTSLITPDNVTPQMDDYICFGVQIDDLTKFTQGIIIFDIKNGAADYITDTLYYIFTLDDMVISGGTNPVLTEDQQQQQAAINEQMYEYTSNLPSSDQIYEDYMRAAMAAGVPVEIAQANWNAGSMGSVNQFIAAKYGDPPNITSLTPLPSSPWATVLIPISKLIRMGNDNTRSLNNCQGVRISIQCTAAINVGISSFWVGGGGQLDASNNQPYLYCFRGRNTLTGAKGNPSPATRAAVSPMRQKVRLLLTDTFSDTQVDVYDIYRYGGTVLSWRRIATVPNSGASVAFIDNFTEAAALGGALLEFDNFEPWPSIDTPFVATSAAGVTINVIGTVITLSGAISWPSNILNWLPGTLVEVSTLGTFTLRRRPELLSANNYRLEIVENAGYLAGAASLTITEPKVANQKLPYLWGPNAQGDIFGAGDPLRPGNVYYIKENDPDSAPDNFNLEISQPSEPILGGEILAGVSFAATSKSWKKLNPAFNTAQHYYKLESQIPRGLAAPYGHCSDNELIYFVAKDGIWATDGSSAKSLTDDDLYNLFPHEGAAGENITYYGYTVYAPDYKRASTFRLGVCNGFLYFDYQDSNANYRTLVYDLKLKAWSVDEYDIPATIHYGVEQPESTLLASTTLYALLAIGFNTGLVGKQTDLHNDNLTAITSALCTGEFDGGDQRAKCQFGDLYLDSNPVSAITTIPLSNGLAANAPTVIAASAVRSFSQISLSGGSLLKFLGLALTWVDDFTVINTPTSINLWQPSLLPRPEITTDRFGDVDNCGTEDYKYLQGFVLDADTFNVAKSIGIRNLDDNTLTIFSVTHNGQQSKPYSYSTPIKTHLVRIEPQDSIAWRLFNIKWIYEPTPETALYWGPTQPTSHGLTGFQHIGYLEIGYESTNPIILTITAIDGISPSVITLPSTGGVYLKSWIRVSPNKARAYKYTATSVGTFRIMDLLSYVKQWGINGEYLPYKILGSEFGGKAAI